MAMVISEVWYFQEFHPFWVHLPSTNFTYRQKINIEVATLLFTFTTQHKTIFVGIYVCPKLEHLNLKTLALLTK